MQLYFKFFVNISRREQETHCANFSPTFSRCWKHLLPLWYQSYDKDVPLLLLCDIVFPAQNERYEFCSVRSRKTSRYADINVEGEKFPHSVFSDILCPRRYATAFCHPPPPQLCSLWIYEILWRFVTMAYCISAVFDIVHFLKYILHTWRQGSWFTVVFRSLKCLVLLVSISCVSGSNLDRAQE
jgi:hypothetical protein